MPDVIASSLITYLASGSGELLPSPRQTAAAAAETQAILSNPQRGGVTYSLYFGDQWRQPFYAVGLDNNLTRMTGLPEVAFALNRFLQAHEQLLKNPRCCIGVWQTKDAEGAVKNWLDIAVLIYNETAARAFALEGNQIALLT